MKNMDYKGKIYEKVPPLDWQAKKYANKKFGRLLVECPVKVEGMVTQPDSTNAIWLTHCDCGNDYCVSMQQIRKTLKKDIVPSCGCIAKEEQDKKYIGKTYGQLTVLERDDEYKKQNNFVNTNTYYKCKCSCGNITHVRINTLVAGEVKSCGCLKEKQDKMNLIPNQMRDLTGQRFGYLVALSPFQKKPEKDIWWNCQCDCGNQVQVRGYSLTQGDTHSCGCLKNSYGEIQIENLLKENNIVYLHDKEYFKDLLLPSGGVGRYDFILFQNNKPYRLIEYDGEQHYKAVDYYGGEAGFIKRQKNDEYKNMYAKTHNLPLVRIPYSVKTITIEMLLQDDYLI